MARRQSPGANLVNVNSPQASTSSTTGRQRATGRSQARSSRMDRVYVPPKHQPTPRAKGKRGQLKIVTELPYDVLLEVFSELEPFDLLQLSRTTKVLRAIILDNNTAFIWKRVRSSGYTVFGAFHVLALCVQAYANLHLPPPPRPLGMNVLQYTNLLFSRNCQVSNIRHMICQSQCQL